VRQIEAPLGKTLLAELVARNLFRLMAYKDEYEVARLHADPAFHARIEAQFEGDYKLHFHLAPPLIATRNASGELQKKKFGPWMLTVFRVLARFKRLRGGALDIMGRTDERRSERALIQEYRTSMEEVMRMLDADRHAAAVEIARIPELIKGYGHVKERHLRAARQRWDELMRLWRESPQSRRAA
ncbi:MAG: indolepyruvate ferredoxin oxidoreductase family protein, partial [Burkholderiaceae bacterium]|nr:indolepyruvate ferredoxin oxidoreductase family protein [Burkholderiaceae bacterium]